MIHNISRYLLTLVALFAMTTGAWADPNILVPTITGDREFYESVEVTMICTSQNACIYYTKNGFDPLALPDNQQIEYKGPITLTETTTIMARAYDGNDWSDVVEVKFTKLTGPKVTYNDAKTEASFEMPAFDATAEYELVRDMSVQMTTKVGDGNDGYRIRLKKNPQSGKFEPAETDVAGMMALIKVHDAIENEDLTFFNMGGAVDCSVNIYAIDAEDKPVGDPIAFPNLVPGRYIAKAVAATGSAYDGETALSNIFVLFQGYEVEIAAGEYVTYYRDEPVRVDQTEQPFAEIYTISEVGETTATLSGPYDAMKALTPMLVFNKSTDKQKILLIPCNEPDLALTVADEFKGTLTGTTIAASDATTSNYAFNGKQFVWVQEAIEVGANKCWLEVSSSEVTAPALALEFGGGTTGIIGVREVNDGNWYDLNGQKLQSKPTKKGVYIMNGRKVIVK